MVRLADLPDYEREHLLAKNMPPLGPAAWVASKNPLPNCGLPWLLPQAYIFAMTLHLNLPMRPFARSLTMRTLTI